MKIVGIIQARIGSQRLPYKMLLSLHGHPIIEWVVRRVKKARLLDDVVVAIPDTDENDILSSFLEELGVKIFRGPEDDVLMRILLAAREHGTTHIVRVCADNPLVSGQEIDHLVDFYLKHPCDYAYNHIPKNNTYPDGLGAEIVSFPFLVRLDMLATEPHHREHCFSFITDNPDQFSIRTFDPPNKMIAHPQLKFDVDTFEDFKLLALKNFTIDTTPEDLVRLFEER